MNYNVSYGELSVSKLDRMSLCEMGPQLKLPINIMKGSMPLLCNTRFPQILAILSIRTHVNSNLPPLIKVLTDFHLINEISRAFYNFDFSFTSTANNG